MINLETLQLIIISKLPVEYVEEYNINKTLAGSLTGLGRKFMSKGDINLAMYALTRATTEKVANYRTFMLLGQVLFTKGEVLKNNLYFKEALSKLQKAVELNPQDPNVWIALGTVSKKLSDRVNTNRCAEVLFTTAQLAKKQGLDDEARKLAEEAYKLSKNDRYKKLFDE